MFPFHFSNLLKSFKTANKDIEAKLENENCSLEDLLIEDSILDEIKYQNNSKLLLFFNKSNVKKLLDYIMIEPTNDDQNTGHRFPFISSEILCSDIPVINDHFLKNEDSPTSQLKVPDERTSFDLQINLLDFNSNENKGNVEKNTEVEKIESSPDKLLRIDLLEYYLSFLDCESELNYVLSGYFSKLFDHLFSKNPSYILRYIYKTKPNIIQRIIFHSDKKSILDLFTKIFQIEAHDEELSKDPEVINIRKTALQAFISNLKSTDFEKICNTYIILSDIIETRHNLELIIQSKEILECFFETLTDSNIYQHSFVESLNSLISLLKFCLNENLTMPTLTSSSEEIVSYNENSVKHTELSKLIKISLIKVFSHFDMEKEIADSGLNIYHNSSGSIYKHLGNKRVKLIEYLYLVFNYMKNINSELDSIASVLPPRYFKLIYEYLFDFEWNNLYQFHFDNLNRYLFLNSHNFPKLMKKLFEEVEIIPYLVSKSNDGHFLFNSNRAINRGYWANYIELCHKINSTNDNFIRNYFTPEWNCFCSEKVTYWKNLFTRQLCSEEKNEHNTSKVISISDIVNMNDMVNFEESLGINKNGDNQYENHENKFSEEDLNNFEFFEDRNDAVGSKIDFSKTINVSNPPNENLDNFLDNNYWAQDMKNFDEVLMDIEL